MFASSQYQRLLRPLKLSRKVFTFHASNSQGCAPVPTSTTNAICFFQDWLHRSDKMQLIPSVVIATIPQQSLVGWSGPPQHFVEGWHVLAVSKEAGVQIEISTVRPGRAENLPQHAFCIMDWHSVFPTICFNRA
jgi:hypothetical protein